MDILVDTARRLTFLMISSADHISGATGLTVTVTLSKDGGTFAAAVGSVVEIGSGWYYLDADEDDIDTLGDLVLHATAGSADPTDVQYSVIDGLVNLGPEQHTTIFGNISGSVGSVTNPVTCTSSSSGSSCRRRCRCGC